MHRAVADRVDRDSEATGRRARDIGAKLDRIEREDAAILGPFIRLLERSGLRSEGAVGEELDVTEL